MLVVECQRRVHTNDHAQPLYVDQPATWNREKVRRKCDEKEGTRGADDAPFCAPFEIADSSKQRALAPAAPTTNGGYSGRCSSNDPFYTYYIRPIPHPPFPTCQPQGILSLSQMY